MFNTIKKLHTITHAHIIIYARTLTRDIDEGIKIYVRKNKTLVTYISIIYF